jgi:SpoVK/Ycf46/Vps4 family AAA+-type ATPase
MPELRTLEIFIGKKSEWAIVSAEPKRPLTEEEVEKIVQQLLTEGQNEDGPPNSGATMPHDWTKDVKKYVSNPDEAAIKGIVKHCGIALRSKDASFVACTDKAERDRVRDRFLKKKLVLSGSDAELDKAIMDVCQEMHADRDKPRVTFYYLLAEKYGKLAAFH